MTLETLYKKLTEDEKKGPVKLHQRTIACDFDGVIATYDGWNGADKFGTPIQKVIKELRDEKEKGSKIIIHTCRLNPELSDNREDVPELLTKYLKDNDVPFDELWIGTGKPIADEYWDDRCVKKP